ncbi:MAG: hypothetical protein JO316_04375 [Abitibacteriaceae bacterium]|nr:hypothetical protein [Abditibacteriaceae bacterium]
MRGTITQVDKRLNFGLRILALVASFWAASGVDHSVKAASVQSVVPPATAVKGWKQLGKTALYNGNNLFDLIDGEAEAVKEFAFVGCANASFAPSNQSRPALTVTIFDMSNPLNAYGLFGSDRISGKPMKLGAEGVMIQQTGLNFWKGRYVVRTTIFQPTPANKAAMMAFAKATAARISGSSAIPAVVQALPPGRQAHSEKYVRQNYAGHSFLSNVITARYPSLGMGAEVFIAQYPSPAAAKGALEAYRGFEKSGTGMKAVAGIGNAAFSVRDKYAKNVVVAMKGKNLVGVIRARDAAQAQNFVKQTVSKVK